MCARMPRAWRRFIAAVAVIGLLSGCAGDDSPTAGSGSRQDDSTTVEGGSGNDDSPGPVEGGSGNDDSPGPVDISEIDDAIEVAPVLDESSAVTGQVGYDGGEVTATGEDGTVYSLSVPADSVRAPTSITMTPLATLDGIPFGDGTAYAVDLQPDGLVLDVTATLTITPPEPIPVDEQLAVGYSGTELALPRLSSDTEDIEIAVDHFSGYGLTRGLLSDVEPVRQRIGGSEQARIENEINLLLAEDRARQLAGGEPSPEVQERFREYLDQFEERVVKPRVEAVDESCATGRLAVYTYQSWARQLAILGERPPSLDTSDAELYDSAHRVCLDEEYQMCVDEHIVHRLLPYYVGSQRSHELLGLPSADVLDEMKQRGEDCMRFELEFTTTGSGDKTGQGSYRYQDSATFTADVEVSFDELRSRPSSAEMTSAAPVYATDLPMCSTTPVDGWSATARFLEMGLTFDVADLTEEIGTLHVEWIEIELPPGPIEFGTVTCDGGRGSFSEGGEALSAPVIYRLAHDDEVIRDWTVHGGEVYATAEWQAAGREDLVAGLTMGWDESGTAILRHTPQ